jgi:hypothetical protein
VELSRADERERRSDRACRLGNGRTGERKIDNHGRSAVSISSLANGALGEHLRHDSDGRVASKVRQPFSWAVRACCQVSCAHLPRR